MTKKNNRGHLNLLNKSTAINSKLLIGLVFSLLFFSNCTENLNPVAPTSVIEDFVLEQNLPDAQEIKYLFEDSKTLFFRVNYGPPFDCLAGCDYEYGIGLYNKTKIAWIRMDSLHQNTKIYDIDQSDGNLFTKEFFSKLEKENEDIFYPFLLLLAGDEDTSTDCLLRISVKLYSIINPYLAHVLLQNPTVQVDIYILTVLVNLPGAIYESIREQARELLDGLGM